MMAADMAPLGIMFIASATFAKHLRQARMAHF